MTCFRLRLVFVGCGFAVLGFRAHRGLRPRLRAEPSAHFASLPESCGSPREQVMKPPLVNADPRSAIAPPRRARVRPALRPL
jgi:hypothetical protein